MRHEAGQRTAIKKKKKKKRKKHGNKRDENLRKKKKSSRRRSHGIQKVAQRNDITTLHNDRWSVFSCLDRDFFPGVCSGHYFILHSVEWAFRKEMVMDNVIGYDWLKTIYFFLSRGGKEGLLDIAL